ncbi:hypothetical protein E2C01_029227 [Portunus trituberculatus]|uniref:Uncharacterized protein n=1 Tax=Portunus trituberculatus TaxID=210409 RepID=A0A5B7EMR6_PORTR|nr:hypothetical protein [Portunus trituberculatus]
MRGEPREDVKERGQARQRQGQRAFTFTNFPRTFALLFLLLRLACSGVIVWRWVSLTHRREGDGRAIQKACVAD